MHEVAVLFATETDLLPAKRFGTRHLASAGGSVAAAAAVFGVVSLVGSITAPAQPEASGNARDVILAAYDSNADSIMHITMTRHNNGRLVISLDDWYSSAQTKPGRTLTHREIMGPPDVRQDSSATFVVPTVGPRPPGCRAVPGASDNRVGELLAVDGKDLNVDYGTKTWFEDKDVCMLWVRSGRSNCARRSPPGSGSAYPARPLWTVSGRSSTRRC
jgi:hypothetical protein